MSLTDKVASMICAEIKDSDGLVYQSAVDTRADIIIALVLNKAKEVFVEQGSILKGVMAIEQLKVKDDE